jgi:hypothetical protein
LLLNIICPSQGFSMVSEIVGRTLSNSSNKIERDLLLKAEMNLMKKNTFSMHSTLMKKRLQFHLVYLLKKRWNRLAK